MSLKIQNIKSTNINLYADSPLKVGDIVAKMDDRPNVICKISLAKHQIPLGIALQNVIKIDDMFNHFSFRCNIPVGSRIEILTKGTIITQLNKRLRIPIHQPMYVDMKRNCLTWKFIGPRVGYTVNDQDKDGYVGVRVNFHIS